MQPLEEEITVDEDHEEAQDAVEDEDSSRLIVDLGDAENQLDVAAGRMKGEIQKAVHNFKIAKWIVWFFGAAFMLPLLLLFVVVIMKSPADTEAIFSKTFPQFLQSVEHFETAVFAGPLGFILGFYYRNGKGPDNHL